MYDYTRSLALRLQAGQITGFTISTITGEAVTHGYAVGGDPECPEVRLSDFADIPAGLLTMHLNHYVTVAHMYGQGYVGGWIHEGDLYLDAPSIYLDGEEAERVSRERRQLAYFDLSAMTEHAIAA